MLKMANDKKVVYSGYTGFVCYSMVDLTCLRYFRYLAFIVIYLWSINPEEYNFIIVDYVNYFLKK